MYPIIFQSDNIIIESYKVILCIGILLSMYKFRQLILNSGIDILLTLSLGLISILIGSKIFDFFFSKNFSGFLNLNKGFNSIGALFGGILVLLFISHKYKISYYYLLDRFGIAVCLGYAVGKLACLSAGCCYGIEYNGPLSISFTDTRCGTPPLNTPLFPSQIIDSILSFCLFLFLNYLAGKKLLNGKIFMLFCISFGLFRFISTLYRNPDSNSIQIGGISIYQNQIIFVCLFLIGLSSFLFTNIFNKINLKHLDTNQESEKK